ncbi:MAG: hypothetical protein IJV96_01190 [Clostridia bacterium]|nr:hypothetical protein [Clostridia bacterium]
MKVFLTIVFYIVVFFVALKLWRVLGCLFHRLCFVAKLKRAVKRKGGSVTVLHCPLRSFFSVYDGEDVLLKIPKEKPIKIKFFPGWIKSKNVSLQDASSAIISRNLFLFTPHQARFGTVKTKYVSSSDAFNGKKKRYSSVFSNRDGENVLMFSPSPISLKGLEGNKQAELDSGALIYKFSVYSTKIFLQKLDR